MVLVLLSRLLSDHGRAQAFAISLGYRTSTVKILMGRMVVQRIHSRNHWMMSSELCAQTCNELSTLRLSVH